MSTYLGTNRGRARLSLDSVSGVIVIPPTNGLLSHWAMRNSGATVYDEATFNIGTAVNSPTFSAANGVRGNGAGMVSASKQYINFGTTALDIPASSDFTLCGWFKSSTNYRNPIVVKQNTGNEMTFGVQIGSAGTLVLQVKKDDNSGTVATVQTGVISTGAWHFFAARATGNYIDIGLNGVMNITPVEVTFTRYGVGAGHTLLMAEGYPVSTGDFHDFDGAIDEVRFYARALSNIEISNIYNYDRAGAGL
jgi:hypothetical protein